MNKTPKMTYKDAGVDTHSGQDFVRQISRNVKKTYNEMVIPDQAGFAGLLDISIIKDYEQPVLVSATDGVGTKLHLARLFNQHHTVGIDLVAMCVNDLLATGAKPLQFLDYIACGKLDPKKMSSIVAGISAGCIQADCVLAGGETAEHPDTMHTDEYDLAGFVTGIVDLKNKIDPSRITQGDVLIALPSSGIHSNGMSLVRKLFLKDGLHLPDDQATCDFLQNEILLKPTVIYEKVLRPVLDKFDKTGLHGISHITGGGFYENIPRILPDGIAARIDLKNLEVPDVFHKIQSAGVDKNEMFNVFNMGIGMLLVVSNHTAPSILENLKSNWKNLVSAPDTLPWIAGQIISEKDSRKIILD